MYIEDFAEIVSKLRSNHEVREDYSDSISELDYCLSLYVIDNKYTNSVCMENDFLIQQLFGELTDHVCWFLYEWKPGYSIGDNGVDYVIETVQDFVDATQQIYQLPMKPKSAE